MKKLYSRRGFTLAEMLIAVLLLGVVTVMATVMTTAVFNTTVPMKQVAQAEILGNEALGNIQNELRFALNLSVTGGEKNNTVTYDKDVNNKGYAMTLNEEGKIVLDHDKKQDLLFAGVSYGSLQIKELTFTYGNAEKTVILVSLSVGNSGDVLWKGELAVSPLNR